MSDTNGDKKPKPIFNPDDVSEPAVDFGPSDSKPAVDFGPSDPKPVDPADVAVEKPVVVDEPVAVEKPKPARKPKGDKVDEPSPASATGSVVPASATGEVAPTDPAFAGREVVYVQAPIPPKLRGNRGVGSLLAALGAVLFAALFGVAVIIAFFFRGDAAPLSTFALFIQNAAFWVPVLVFLVAFVLLVLVVNRAGWAAHVFGSLVVALVTYFGSIGLLLLIGNISAAATGGGTPTFGTLALNPFVIIAALVAREVSIWIGLAIAARGRRVKVKNLELVDEWEQEHAETKAQYERAGTTT